MILPPDPAKYPDGTHYLVMQHDRKAPFFTPGVRELLIISEERDFKVFRREDVLLPPPNPPEPAIEPNFDKPSAPGFVLAEVDDGHGGRKLTRMRDPISKSWLLVAGKRQHVLSRDEVAAMGLRAFVPGAPPTRSGARNDTGGAVVAKYSDGRMFLVMQFNGKKPFRGAGPLEVVTSKLDIDIFRKSDPRLPAAKQAGQAGPDAATDALGGTLTLGFPPARAN